MPAFAGMTGRTDNTMQHMFAAGTHAMFPDTLHDEQARQDFVRAMRLHVNGTVQPGLTPAYEKIARPSFAKSRGRAPANRTEVRQAMQPVAYAQMWSALLRTTQELLYDAVGPSIERQAPVLNERARALAARNSKRGSLMLDPGLAIPRYHTAADIHCKPGGYHTELGVDDVSAGAEYERTLHVYMMGQLGPHNDDIARSTIARLKREHPGFAPRRILDMGCTDGHNTLPWAEAFPDAEVHAIDVAAPCLRYAHARAQAMDVGVHFAQMNAEMTGFPAGRFDIVTSAIMLHETSNAAIRAIFRESHRLLAKGGFMLHVEARPMPGDPFNVFMQDWSTHNNGEPFLGTLQDLDVVQLVRDAGFGASAFEQRVPSVWMPVAWDHDAKSGRRGSWWIAGGRK